MKGNSGMRMRKHGRSGRSGKSPKRRLALRRDAGKDERRARKYPMVGSIAQLLRKQYLDRYVGPMQRPLRRLQSRYRQPGHRQVVL